jgi:two-component system sensor histidine kinase QseC
VVVVAGSRAHVDEVLQALLAGLIASWLVVSGLTVLLVAQTVRRGLAPLARLADQAAAADVSSLTYRFSPQSVPLELAPICVRLNDLLERLAAARERERRFTADVAHELRTPIAELRSLSEVALRWPPDVAASSRAFADARDIAVQMEAIVTALLALARSDAGRQVVARQNVDLCEIVRASWHSYAGMAEERGLLVELQLPDAAPLESDRTLLASMVGNLLSNAAEYSPRGGRLRCVVSGAGPAIEMTVVNTNETLQPEDLRHIFEPFWRKDSARSQAAHSGLGLSLVATYAELLGASLRADLTGGCFEIHLRFDGAAAPSVPV